MTRIFMQHILGVTILMTTGAVLAHKYAPLGPMWGHCGPVEPTRRSVQVFLQVHQLQLAHKKNTWGFKRANLLWAQYKLAIIGYTWVIFWSAIAGIPTEFPFLGPKGANVLLAPHGARGITVVALPTQFTHSYSPQFTHCGSTPNTDRLSSLYFYCQTF